MADWIPIIEANRCDLFDILHEKYKDTKGQSEAVIRSTYITMDKGERITGQTMIYKTLHIKLKIGQHEPIKTGVELKCFES